MRAKGSPYEVRCLRCDVSFPVETRRCIHCGGPTSASDAVVGVGSPSPGALESARASAPSMPPSNAPIGIDSSDPYPWNRSRERAAEKPIGPIAGEGGLEIPDERPASVGSALLRSFGSLFWIVALIGFSIVRSCSEK